MSRVTKHEIIEEPEVESESERRGREQRQKLERDNQKESESGQNISIEEAEEKNGNADGVETMGQEETTGPLVRTEERYELLCELLINIPKVCNVPFLSWLDG